MEPLVHQTVPVQRDHLCLGIPRNALTSHPLVYEIDVVDEHSCGAQKIFDHELPDDLLEEVLQAILLPFVNCALLVLNREQGSLGAENE